MKYFETRDGCFYALQFDTEQEAEAAKQKTAEISFGLSSIEHHPRSKKPWWFQIQNYEIAEIVEKMLKSENFK
jgi:hypothetical protein